MLCFHSLLILVIGHVWQTKFADLWLICCCLPLIFICCFISPISLYISDKDRAYEHPDCIVESKCMYYNHYHFVQHAWTADVLHFGHYMRPNNNRFGLFYWLCVFLCIDKAVMLWYSVFLLVILFLYSLLWFCLCIPVGVPDESFAHNTDLCKL